MLEQPLLASSCLNDQARFNESWHKSMVMNSSGRLVITRPDLYVFKVTSLIPHRPPTAAISKPAQFFQVLRTTGAPGVTPEIAISHMLTFVSLLGDAVFDGLRTTDAWKTYGVSQHLARIACPSKEQNTVQRAFTQTSFVTNPRYFPCYWTGNADGGQCTWSQTVARS